MGGIAGTSRRRHPIRAPSLSIRTLAQTECGNTKEHQSLVHQVRSQIEEHSSAGSSRPPATRAAGAPGESGRSEIRN